MNRHALRLALAVALALALVVGGCAGGSAEREPGAAEATTNATAPAPTVATAPAPTVATAPTAPPGAPEGAETVRDPGGAYELDIDPGWTEIPAGRFQAWAVGSRSSAFADNVNVLVQRPSSGVTLEEYLDLSLRQAPAILDGYELVSRGLITLSSGQPGARWAYRGRPTGRDLQFLAVIGVTPGRAVVVTLTAEPDRFAAAAAGAEPYMRTLRLP